jgi:hypothetical protein
MKTLSVKEAAKLYETADLGSFFGGDVDWQYPDPVPSYFLPRDSGQKVALARLLANTFLTFLGRGPALLWITATGISSSSEQMDLFTGYRSSHGETRTVSEAPVHVFQAGDMEAFVSILSLALFFYWDGEILSQDRSLAITISHDEWIEYRFARGFENFVPYFEKHFASFTKASAKN